MKHRNETKTPAPRPCILADTREQLPYPFTATVDVARVALPEGDYSVLGLEGRVAVERKSLADLVGSLTAGHERFTRELVRLQTYQFARVLIEADVAEILRHEYRSQIKPVSLMRMVCSIETDYRIPFCWAGNRRTAAAFCQHYLTRLWLREHDPMPRCHLHANCAEEKKP